MHAIDSLYEHFRYYSCTRKLFLILHKKWCTTNPATACAADKFSSFSRSNATPELDFTSFNIFVVIASAMILELSKPLIIGLYSPGELVFINVRSGADATRDTIQMHFPERSKYLAQDLDFTNFFPMVSNFQLTRTFRNSKP